MCPNAGTSLYNNLRDCFGSYPRKKFNTIPQMANFGKLKYIYECERFIYEKKNF